MTTATHMHAIGPHHASLGWLARFEQFEIVVRPLRELRLHLTETTSVLTSCKSLHTCRPFVLAVRPSWLAPGHADLVMMQVCCWHYDPRVEILATALVNTMQRFKIAN